MTPKRGDRAAPPPPPDGYTLEFATGDAAKGWEELCRVAAANTRTAYQALESNPCPNPATTRHHQLTGQLSTDTYGRQGAAAVAVRSHRRRTHLVPRRPRHPHLLVETGQHGPPESDRVNNAGTTHRRPFFAHRHLRCVPCRAHRWLSEAKAWTPTTRSRPTDTPKPRLLDYEDARGFGVGSVKITV